MKRNSLGKNTIKFLTFVVLAHIPASGALAFGSLKAASYSNKNLSAKVIVTDEKGKKVISNGYKLLKRKNKKSRKKNRRRNSKRK